MERWAWRARQGRYRGTTSSLAMCRDRFAGPWPNENIVIILDYICC